MSIDRRIVRVIVSVELLDCMFREGYVSRGQIRTFRGIPADAKYVGARHCMERDAVAFVYQHDSFEPVPDGEIVPTFDVTIGEASP